MMERVHAEENIKVLFIPKQILSFSCSHIGNSDSLKAFHISNWRGEIF